MLPRHGRRTSLLARVLGDVRGAALRVGLQLPDDLLGVGADQVERNAEPAVDGPVKQAVGEAKRKQTGTSERPRKATTIVVLKRAPSRCCLRSTYSLSRCAARIRAKMTKARKMTAESASSRRVCSGLLGRMKDRFKDAWLQPRKKRAGPAPARKTRSHLAAIGWSFQAYLHPH